MKNIVIFPYHPDINAVFRQRKHLKEYKLIGVMSFKEDETVISSFNKKLESDHLTDEELIATADAVILLDDYRDCKKDKYYQIIDMAQLYSVEVIITPAAELQLDLDKYAGRYKRLEHLCEGFERIDGQFNVLRGYSVQSKLFDIDVPVIGVMGLGKYCDKFETQLMTKTVMEDEYNIRCICSNSLGVLFGCYTLPDFLFDALPFQEKVIRMNQYIKAITEDVKIDALIIGVPEGIAPFSEKETNHFGEYPLVISKAVPIDLTVLCLYFVWEEISVSGIHYLANEINTKYATRTGAIAVSRTMYDVPSEDFEKMIYTVLDEQYLHKYYPKQEYLDGIYAINMFEQGKGLYAIKNCINQLADNAKSI